MTVRTIPVNWVVALAMARIARVLGLPRNRKGYRRAGRNRGVVEHVVAVGNTTAVTVPARSLRCGRKVSGGIQQSDGLTHRWVIAGKVLCPGRAGKAHRQAAEND